MTDLSLIPVERRQEMLRVAREELLRLDGIAYAKTSLLGFVKWVMPEYEVGAHHRVLCDALERVARGECLRLMVFMPPRHGKSLLVSRMFPSWYLGLYPKREIIAASYNNDMAKDFGRWVRNTVAGEKYREVFPGVELAEDSQSANMWHTNQGGVYLATGIGGRCTGMGAHCLLIDDPVKDREDAESSLVRAATWDWYTSTAYTRLMPQGAVVVVQTRWHTDDLAGRLLEARDKFGGDPWEVIDMPARSRDGQACDDGEALWPAWYPVERLEQIRQVIGHRDWAALYQQSPVLGGGQEFKRDWLRWYEGRLTGEGMNVYIVVDPANEKKATSDYTVIWVIGLGQDENYYLIDGIYDRLNLHERAREVLRLHRKYRPKKVGYERYGKDSDAQAIKMVQEKENYRFDICEMGGRVRKNDRIRRLIELFEESRIYMPASLHKTTVEGKTVDLIEILLAEEFDRFPVCKHDDGLDCLARILDADLNAIFPSQSRYPNLDPTPGQELAGLQRLAKTEFV
jgi:predicted phage terminase large subunit-like protein